MTSVTSVHGLSVISRYNLALATLMETFVAPKNQQQQLQKVPYYQIGPEFLRNERLSLQSSPLPVVGQALSLPLPLSFTTREAKDNAAASIRAVLHHSMVHEEHLLENLQDDIVQQCLKKNDRAGAINVFLNRQFNSLQQKIPYLIGSTTLLVRGRRTMSELAHVLCEKQSVEGSGERDIGAPPRKRGRRTRTRPVLENAITANVNVEQHFMKIDAEEDAFEQMLLREAAGVKNGDPMLVCNTVDDF
jgi:hypothetical protein